MTAPASPPALEALEARLLDAERADLLVEYGVRFTDIKWLIAAARERDALLQRAERAEQRAARLIGVLKEYEEADVNDGIMQERLKAANDRAEALYRQYEANRDDDELQARRRENLEDCLRLADVAAQARRRKQAARQAIKAALIDAALAPEHSVDVRCPCCNDTGRCTYADGSSHACPTCAPEQEAQHGE